MEGSTKSGKTQPCLWWLMHEAGKDRGCEAPEYWWVAPIMDQAAIAFRRMVRMWRAVDPCKRTWDYNKTEKSITLGSGAVFRFKGSDDPDSIYGEDVYALVMDEASRCKEEAWHAARSVVTATRGKLRIIGNVKGRHNWSYRLARSAEKGDLPGWHYARITCYDAVKAGILSGQEVEAARRELPESVFRELYEGVPSDDGSNPFGLGHIAACVQPLAPTEPAAFGVDLGKATDSTVVIGLDESGLVCSFDKWLGIPWPETIGRVAALVGDRPALVDSTGLGDVVADDLQRRCPMVEKFLFTPKSKQQLMEGLAVAIQSSEVGYPDGPIKMELEQFEWMVKQTYTAYSAPAGMHDDCVCALALAVKKLGSRQRVELVGTWGKPVARPSVEETVQSTYARLREDPGFGFEPSVY